MRKIDDNDGTPVFLTEQTTRTFRNDLFTKVALHKLNLIFFQKRQYSQYSVDFTESK